MEVCHPNAAGIDIGSRNFFVSAEDDEVKVFPTYKEGCHEVRDYLASLGITTVAMESTGVYWVVLYAVLEEAGLDVYLVNGRDAKNVPGRKSDVKDCQWLRQLHSYGLLKKSFIPGETTRQLRGYMRLRQDHIRAQATQAHLMQKSLTQMNLRLTEAISDIMGASGRAMLDAILGGERDPEALVSLCHEKILQTKRDLVLKSLQGDYRAEHLFALRHARQTWDYYQAMILECDREMEKLLGDITGGMGEIKLEGKRKAIRYNKPQIDGLPQLLLKMTGGKDPTGIAGITDYTFLQIVSELGTDMDPWPTEKQFIGWLKLGGMRSSSGNVSKRVVAKRTNKASLLFRNVAQGILTSKHLALGSFGRRVRSKRGSGVAIKAVARKIACYYYRVMTKGIAFVEKGIEMYEAQQKAQQQKYLEKMALKLNMHLVPA